jgi:hypothetical protein
MNESRKMVIGDDPERQALEAAREALRVAVIQVQAFPQLQNIQQDMFKVVLQIDHALNEVPAFVVWTIGPVKE